MYPSLPKVENIKLLLATLFPGGSLPKSNIRENGIDPENLNQHDIDKPESVVENAGI